MDLFYGAGFIGNISLELFLLFIHLAMLQMKIDPAFSGNEYYGFFTNTEVEYALSVVQASDDYLNLCFCYYMMVIYLYQK